MKKILLVKQVAPLRSFNTLLTARVVKQERIDFVYEVIFHDKASYLYTMPFPSLPLGISAEVFMCASP